MDTACLTWTDALSGLAIGAIHLRGDECHHRLRGILPASGPGLEAFGLIFAAAHHVRAFTGKICMSGKNMHIMPGAHCFS